VAEAAVDGPTRVLIVTDRPLLAGLVSLALAGGLFEAHRAVGAAEAIGLLDRSPPGLLILDLELEGTDGASLLAHLHPAHGAAVPVLALSGRADLRMTLDAFERGVDDVMAVSFSPEELRARASALVRRRAMRPATFAPALRLGELEIDVLHRTVRVAGGELDLPSLEMDLLSLLADNAGRVVTREQIVGALWGTGYVAGGAVGRRIHNVRAQLADDWRHPRFIVTVPGQGYRLVPPSVAAEAASTD
jgi:two-component system KDP operon response regulator KdpE